MVKTFEPLVTCIIPVYNAETYLEQGLDSLLNQSYKNLEILLVDDHSSDASWGICEKYVAAHQNITAIQTEKNSGGPLEGRRLGVKEATGEWLTFMDSDDYVKKDYIKHLVEGTENGKYDISVTGHSLLYEDGTVEDFKWKNYSQSTAQRLNAFYDDFLHGKYHDDPANTVGQNLIRAEIAKKTNLDHLPNNIYAEDTVMALSFLANSKDGVNFVDHHDFMWRQVAGSGSHGGFYRRADRDAFYDACDAIFSREDIKKELNKDIGKISIVVPVYNVEEYLSMCVDSILGQTYKNIEVILVDDKSPDNSGKIADEYAKKDPRVQVIHKSKNEGLNMARATGFEVTSGTYIMFVDSDDAIAKDCIEFALRAIVKRKAEFAKFNVLTFADVTELPDGLTSVDPLGEEKVIIGKPDLYRSRFENKLVGSARVTVWGGLYPREVVKKINWLESDYRQFEDMHWTLHFLEHVNKGVFVSRVGYFYRVDKRNGKVLSKSLSGNSLNGSPVGYLEFASIYLKKLENYNHKYKLGIEKEIDQYRAWLWIDRLSKISKATMFTSENNLDYLSTAIETVVEKYMSAKKTISKDEDSIKALDEEILALHHEINTLRAEKEKLKEELRSLGSIKRSAHLLLDNTKRKIKTMIK